MTEDEKLVGEALGTIALTPGEKFTLEDVVLMMGVARRRRPNPGAIVLRPQDVEWVVNDSAELGVKIGNQFFFLYKGDSLVYGKDDEEQKVGIALHSDEENHGQPMHWRTVGKREFGECCHPLNREDPTKYGTVSLDDCDRWQTLPAATLSTNKE